MDLRVNKEYLETLFKLHLMIAYEGSGNFTKFNDIFIKSGLAKNNTNKYACFNALYALAVQGLIDLYWSDNAMRWLCREDFSNSSQLFGEELLDIKNKSPVIFCDSVPLGFKRREDAPSFINQLENVSSIGTVTDHVLYCESNINLFSETNESYCFDTFKWIQSESLDEINTILRVKERFSGFKYFLYLYKTRKLYKILEPDWMFVVGGYMCTFDFRKLIHVTEAGFSVPASFRLPIFLARFLFHNSESLHLGFKTEYKKVNMEALNALTNYLMPGVKGV